MYPSVSFPINCRPACRLDVSLIQAADPVAAGGLQVSQWRIARGAVATTRPMDRSWFRGDDSLVRGCSLTRCLGDR